MGYPITEMFIAGLPQTGYRNGVGAYEGVVAHATDNYGDTAVAERNYEANGHWQSAYVHFFVDDVQIVQVANTAYKAWGAGSVANARFVHVELCQTYDAGKFNAAYDRYTWLLAKILADRKLGVSRRGTLWTHHDVTQVLGGTSHTDPDNYLASHGKSIDQLVADVQAKYNEIINPPAPVAPRTATRHVKIVGVHVAAIMMDYPDRINANNIGTIPLNTVVDMIVPVAGYNNGNVGYYKIVYGGKTGYVNCKYADEV